MARSERTHQRESGRRRPCGPRSLFHQDYWSSPGWGRQGPSGLPAPRHWPPGAPSSAPKQRLIAPVRRGAHDRRRRQKVTIVTWRRGLRGGTGAAQTGGGQLPLFQPRRAGSQMPRWDIGVETRDPVIGVETTGAGGRWEPPWLAPEAARVAAPRAYWRSQSMCVCGRTTRHLDQGSWLS